MSQLSLEQKNKVWGYVTELLNLKSDGKSVTHFS
jgi:ribosomal protein S17E